MRTLTRAVYPACASFLIPKHSVRASPLALNSSSTWTRSFSASRKCRALDLAYTLHDEQGKSKGDPIIILHGLFGSKKNNRSVSNAFSRALSRPVYALDLRNHGDSPQEKPHNYTALSQDVLNFLKKHNLKDATLIGHSMGAKTVMAMALQDPDCCANIVAVDNAPVDAALASDFPKYVEGMRKIESAKCTSQKAADEILTPYAKELPVRQFLLTNLIRPSPGEPLKFRIPIKILGDALDDMADFPFKNPDEVRFSKKALFVRGTKSHYVS
ncbi:alpha/beta-hydrolase, partial [Periconia macrospinosa]